ncbi:MAG: DNA mismatch repair protein MutS [Candidatus Gastranaerophilales bacterium]|nr:DNA mismatch repair protein MutS [Candidatus Gastranaerophilales bacterium]MCM1072911.1 DNA mismatch repair protein MutS [Bacteroides sp.]
MTKPEINYINSADVDINETTDVMKQYLNIKRENPDSILFYRLGDFYETFFEDAELLSRELELTLTGRDAGKTYGRVPLAGIPFKAAENYLEKLVEKGYKVAICEQLEDPKQAKGLVKRGVVRTITAGTLVESRFLNQTSNNYICALFEENEKWGFAYTDISTGEFKAATLNYDAVLTELARIQPSEIIAPAKKLKLEPFQIVPEETVDLPDEITKVYNCAKVPSRVFEEDFAQNNLKTVLKINSLDSVGYKDNPLAYRASAGVFAYIWENMKEGFPKFERIELYELSAYVALDVNSRKNLELTETLREKNKYGSLLWAIDKTVTNMGTRLLKSWICQPLKDIKQITERQNIVKSLVNNNSTRSEIERILRNIYDIQRLSTRVSNNSANPKDFVSLKASLMSLPELINTAKSAGLNVFDNIETRLPDIEQYADLIDKTINDDPPNVIKEGGVIKSGVNSSLDYLRDLLTNGEDWLKRFEETEREKTGIPTLKVGYNRVFGYFIEVTNSNLTKVPETYIRKQTLTGAERFITDSLKKHEDEVLTAQVKANDLEYKLYCDFRDYSKEFVTLIREIAQAVAELDVYNSFASIAVEQNYTCPEMDESSNFIIKNGRHPVLEKILPLGAYVPNDLELSCEETQLMILTGPNMAGKSTFMRQNALIVILAQIGAFVPADYAKIGVVDKIFTRVGASDDLTLGKSTFMVEMTETAYILNSATEKSLILIDEIGRGTSTYDGVAIAWSVAEYIASKIGAKCIFATHYHELNVMTKTYPQIKSFRITIAEQNGEIEFLRKIVPGGASKSYGIQVAKMAGLPNKVIERSEELMKKLQKDFSKDLAGRKKNNDATELEAPQLNLF